jgi:DNA-binding transcriptional ArsR family regulator
MASLNLNVAEIAALVGDPARTNILAALMDVRALTSKELSYIAGVIPQTTSGHLAKLTTTNLLILMKRGRRHYYRIASPLVGQMLESIMAVASAQPPPLRRRPSRMEERMRIARTCYDHLAGRLGVALADTLVTRGQVGGEMTASGCAFLSRLGVLLDGCKQSRRLSCRPCLDWSERLVHLAGSIGVRSRERCLELGWIKQLETTRALETPLKDIRGLLNGSG